MNLVPRSVSGLRPPKGKTSAQLTGISTGHWNGPTVLALGQPTWDHSKCASLLRGIQNFHMDTKGWNDIAYNFVICPHGYVFEGRGLNVVNGANGTNNGNRTSHAVMVLAGQGNPFPDAEKAAFRECVKYIDDNTLAPDGAIGHRDHKATECPGNERYHWIHQGMPVSGEVPQPSPNPTPTPPSNTEPTLRLGSTGNAVRRVQEVIRTRAGGNIVVDGVFGPQTDRRVKDLQRVFGLTTDGIVGRNTWGAIKFLESLAPTTPAFGNWPSLTKPLIKKGVKSEAVRYLQKVISTKAGGSISIDGVFGSQTERRVKDLQRVFGMTQDGIVGPKTWGVVDFLARA